MSFLLALIPPLMWAVSPIAVRWTHQAYDPYWAFALRTCLAACFSLPVLLVARKIPLGFAFVKRAAQTSCLVFAAMFLSNVALKYTSVGKAVFYSSSYFILVSLWSFGVRRQPISALILLSLVIALLGLGCISEFTLQVFNLGDALGVVSACFFAAYMVVLEAEPGLTARPFALNALQCLFMAPMSLGLAKYYNAQSDLIPLVEDALSRGDFTLPLVGVLLLGTCVSWLSYSAQTYAQNKLPAHVVGVILLLDSPLASLGGYVFLGDSPSRWTVVGGSLIFGAALLMVAGSRSTRRSEFSVNKNVDADKHNLEAHILKVQYKNSDA
jgi:drug/metabolite transporter (DMT)-like permease